eukprot:scaffold5517_cov135-Cylindrotheca_fusiformis.AAC.5
MQEPNGLEAAEISRQIKKLVKELPDIREDANRLDELRRLFARLVASGDFDFGSPIPGNPAKAKWRAFLSKQHKAMVAQLCARIADRRHSSIRCLFGVIAASPVTSKETNAEFVNSDLLEKWLQAITQVEAEEMDKGMRRMLESEFFRPYRDIQYYSLGSITRLATAEYKQAAGSVFSRVGEILLELLMMIPLQPSPAEFESQKCLFQTPEGTSMDEMYASERDEDNATVTDGGNDASESESDSDNSGWRPSKRLKTDRQRPSYQQFKLFRREYQRAWLAVLKLRLPIVSLKRALQFLPDNVLNSTPNPLRFCDFFMQAYSDHGQGVVGVFSLDGLFILITEHGLEYPDFYSQLYALISPRVMYAKYRERFFSLLGKCLLRNEMLPAHLVAAFVKRLCRCSLSAPPSGALFVLALVSNLLRKHPECGSLIHRGEGNEIEDMFSATQNDPTISESLRTSLWELMALERHYHPAVCTIARSIGSIQELKSPLHDMDMFSGYTYKSLFDMERKKKTATTALTFKTPSSLFTDDDSFSNILASGRSGMKNTEGY